MSDPSPTPPRRRWYQFSLRAMLLVIAVVAAPAAWVAKERRQSRHEQQIATQLKAMQVSALLGGPYDLCELFGPQESQSWWRKLARNVLGERIVAVGMRWGHYKDLTLLAELSHLHILFLEGEQFTNLTPLSDLQELQFLRLTFTKVSDLRPLAGLPKLRYVTLLVSPVTDVTPLAEVKTLEFLELEWGNVVTKESLDALRKALPNCRIEEESTFLSQ